jgi:hypothetical protein
LKSWNTEFLKYVNILKIRNIEYMWNMWIYVIIEKYKCYWNINVIILISENIEIVENQKYWNSWNSWNSWNIIMLK